MFGLIMKTDINRFIHAQNSGEFGATFNEAIHELQVGKKTGHWIWYILPTLKHPKSQSLNARQFALQDEKEALAYIKNSILRERYLEVLQLIYQHSQNKSLLSIMGNQTDVDKLYSSTHLFAEITAKLQSEKNTQYHDIHHLCLLLQNPTHLNPIILELNEFIEKHHQKNLISAFVFKLRPLIHYLDKIIFGNGTYPLLSKHPEISAAYKLIAFLENRTYHPLSAEEISCFEHGDLYQLQEKYHIDPKFFLHRKEPKL